jgi:hypothetical protein
MSTYAAELDGILAKLASLKDLAERPGSAGEAAAATAAIQRLLFVYNLTMADVPNKGEEFVDRGFHVDGDLNASEQRWKSWLLAAVARANFCRIISRHRTWEDNARVVGRIANVRVVIEMYQYLEANAKRQCLGAWKLQQACRFADEPSQSRALFNRGFYVSYVHVISDRLMAQVKSSTQEAGAKGSALVVQLDREVDAALERFHPTAVKSRESKRRISVSADGMAAGHGAAKSVNLDKQVHGSEQVALTG